MNKAIRNLSIFCFSFLCSLLNVSTSNINSSLINDNGVFECNDHCCNENELIHHEIEGKPIIGLPSTLSFNKTMATSSSEYGEVTVKANYEPEGCLTDTIWESSNPSVIRIDVDELDSSIATLVCLSLFEGEITITARSVYFEDISYSCKATYKDEFEITPLVQKIELTGKRVKDCPGDTSYTFSYVNQVDVKTLYKLSEEVPVTYKVNGSGVILNGDYLRMNQAVNSSLSITIIPTGYEELAIDIPISTSFRSEEGTHNYVKSVYKEAYESSVSWGSWSSYTTTKQATCTSSGQKRRSRSGTYYSYSTEYKHVCSYCNDTYYTGGTSSKKTTTDYDYLTIDPLGHNYTKLISEEKEATCREDGVSAKYQCSRCSATKGGQTISALGHSWGSSKKVYRCNYCGRECSWFEGTSMDYWNCPGIDCGGDGYIKVYDRKTCTRSGCYESTESFVKKIPYTQRS